MGKNTTTMANAQATYDGLTPEDVYGVDEEEEEQDPETLLYEAYAEEGWIHPEEDLPLANDLVLAVSPTDKGGKYYIAYLDLSDKWVANTTDQELDVIAWQHLPEIPEGEW